MEDVRYQVPPEFTHLDDFTPSHLEDFYQYVVVYEQMNRCLRGNVRRPAFVIKAPPESTTRRGSFYGQPVPAESRTGGYAQFQETNPLLKGAVQLNREGQSKASARDMSEIMKHHVDHACTAKEAERLDEFASPDAQPVNATSPDAVEVLDKLAQESKEATLQDPAVQKAARRWSACMADAGFQVSTPHEQLQRGDWPSLEETPESSAIEEEKRTAVADAACRSKTGYLDAFVTAMDREQARMINENQAALAAAAPAKREALMKARMRYLQEGQSKK